MDNALNNPAGRVHLWLSKAEEIAAATRAEVRQYTGRSNPRHQTYRALDAWCAVWGLDSASDDDQLEAFRRGYALIDAGREVRRLASESSNPGAVIALRQFTEVERCLGFFRTLPNAQIVNMMDEVKPTGWQSLEVLSAILSHESHETVLAAGSAADLLGQTDELIQLVLGSDLTAEQKLALTERLAEVQAALRRIEVTGTDTVTRATDGLIGAVVRLGLGTRDALGHPVSRGAFKLIYAITVALGAGADYEQIAQSPLGTLLGLPGAS